MSELQQLLRTVAEKSCRASVWIGPRIRDKDSGIGEALKLCTEARLVLERVEMGLCKQAAIAEEMLRENV